VGRRQLITPPWSLGYLFPENPMVAIRHGQAVEKRCARGQESNNFVANASSKSHKTTTRGGFKHYMAKRNRISSGC
jgi:hypothetical protein